MKKLGFFIGLGYQFICECGKSLPVRFPQDKSNSEIVSKMLLYRQCECCSRIYKISIDNASEQMEEESAKIASLLVRLQPFQLEASLLGAPIQVDILPFERS